MAREEITQVKGGSNKRKPGRRFSTGRISLRKGDQGAVFSQVMKPRVANRTPMIKIAWKLDDLLLLSWFGGVMLCIYRF